MAARLVVRGGDRTATMPRSTPWAAWLALLCACSGDPDGTAVQIPGGEAGIGFDDLRYSSTLGKVLAPAGRTGDLDLVDPISAAVTRISGFGGQSSYGGGHDDGPTSVDEGRGFLFVTDRTAQEIAVVDPAAAAVVSRTPLDGHPDYVRYVAATGEVWVTEPSAGQIEIFALSTTTPPGLSHAGVVAVDNGPESLVIDNRQGRAYTHRWQRSTLAIDVKSRAVVADWPNGCAASRGIAVDEEHGFLFAVCWEGTVTVLDTAHEGRRLSTIARGSGYDVIGYAPRLGHLYLAGSSCGCLVVIGVSTSGRLSLLGRLGAAGGSHCAVADDRGQVWVCDPDGGRLWRTSDPWPAGWGAP
jgi:DNA-binding beta-propeller fold protein YncE